MAIDDDTGIWSYDKSRNTVSMARACLSDQDNGKSRLRRKEYLP
jgi:hypothetical protein